MTNETDCVGLVAPFLTPFTDTYTDYPDTYNIPAKLLVMLGCDSACVGCHNEVLKDPNYKLDQMVTMEILKFTPMSLISTLLINIQNNTPRQIFNPDKDVYPIIMQGGDPLSTVGNNISFTIKLINILNAAAKNTDVDIYKNIEDYKKYNRPPDYIMLDNALKIIKRIRICIYTGKEIDYVKQEFIPHIKNNNNILEYIKVGPYIQSKKQQPGKTTKEFNLASTNQEVYSVCKDSTLTKVSKKGKITFV